MRRLVRTALGFAVCLAAPTIAAAQAGATVTIRVQPNLLTQPRDGFTVCVGSLTSRAYYGAKVTDGTGIVTFTGIPVGSNPVATVTKSSFGGREQQWLVPAGSGPAVIITMFTGSGGPTCSVSSAAITVDPGSTTGRGGFYVCVGTSQNRAEFGKAVTPTTGTVSFTNLPGSGMIKATIIRAGYTGVERDWYPTPGQAVVLTLPIAAGSGDFTCPGYVAPFAKSLTAASPMGGTRSEVRLPYASPPAAKVSDQYGNPLAGAVVAFTVTRGNGVISPASVATGADGIARAVSWQLGPNPELNTVSVTTAGVAIAIDYYAIGILVPATLSATSALSQQGQVGKPVPESPAVVVRDRNGTLVPAAKVSFTASAGSGSVSPAVVATGADGIARLTSWTLGSVGGEATVLAGMSGLTSVKFTASVLVTATETPLLLPAPAPPPPPRLLEEALGCHGDCYAGADPVKYSCHKFGTSYVLVGLKVNHRVTELYGIDLFCARLGADGTLGTSIFLPATVKTGGSVQAICPSGQAVVGIQGTEGYYVQSLQLHCSKILPTGLANGSVPMKLTPALGIVAGRAWAPDLCTQNRPASAVKVRMRDFLGDGMFSLQMLCEQPTRGS